MSFAELRRRILASSDETLKGDVAAMMSASMLKLVSDNFLGSHDPYNVAWEPIRGGRMPLMKTRRMWRSATAQAEGPRATVAITANYSGFHQKGTSAFAVPARTARQSASGRFVGKGARTAFLLRTAAHTNPGIKARPMVPDERGLPPAWEAVFRRDTIAVLRRRAGA
jgi:phage gpG-like protein